MKILLAIAVAQAFGMLLPTKIFLLAATIPTKWKIRVKNIRLMQKTTLLLTALASPIIVDPN